MSGLQLTEFVKRPDVGNTGRATRVRANFFEVQSFPQNNIHHYDVTITPDVPPVINRKIWKTFEDQDGQGSLKGIKPVYDGRKNIFSPKALPLEDNAGMFEVYTYLPSCHFFLFFFSNITNKMPWHLGGLV
jgi:eukaryotic translation initiation factor 2C